MYVCYVVTYDLFPKRSLSPVGIVDFTGNYGTNSS